MPPALLPAAAFSWVLLLLAAPLAIATHRAPIAALAVYGAGSIVCHQMTDRSFALGGVQLPVCGRCTGLYLAGACGAVAVWLSGGRRRLPEGRRAQLALAAAAVPMAVSLGLEWTGLAAGSNLSRFLSAVSLGLVGGWVLQRTVEHRA